MTNRYLHVLLHPTANLFRAPIYSKQVFNIGPGSTVNFGETFTLSSSIGNCMSLLWSITSTTTISSQFSTNCRSINTYCLCNLRLSNSLFKQYINTVSLLSGELFVFLHLCSSFLSEKEEARIRQLFPLTKLLSCT